MGGKQNNWTTGMGVNCIMANEITTPMEPAGRVLPLFRGEYSDSIVYENPDIVLYENSSYVAKQITIGNPPPKNASSNDYWQMIAKGIIDADISESTVEFTEASERSNIKNGEKTNIIMGKIMKFFADLKDVAFSGSYVDLSNKPTIPASAKNGKLTIQINGIEVQTFTANQSTNAVANILVPTISNSAAVTQTGQMALDAVEKNAAVPGTLAHQVQQVNSNLSDKAVARSGYVQGISGSVATIKLAPFTNYLFFAYMYVYFIQTYSQTFDLHGLIPAPEDFITLNTDSLNLKITKNTEYSFYMSVLNMGGNKYNFLDA